jgi:hypothetical protein
MKGKLLCERFLPTLSHKNLEKNKVWGCLAANSDALNFQIFAVFLDFSELALPLAFFLKAMSSSCLSTYFFHTWQQSWHSRSGCSVENKATAAHC